MPSAARSGGGQFPLNRLGERRESNALSINADPVEPAVLLKGEVSF